MHTDQPEEGVGDAVGLVSERFAEFRQAQVLGVEVLGLQPVFHGPVHPGNAGQVRGEKRRASSSTSNFRSISTTRVPVITEFYVRRTRAGHDGTIECEG